MRLPDLKHGALFLLSALIFCSVQGPLSSGDKPGTGSEVIALKGTIVYEGEIPASGIEVFLRLIDPAAALSSSPDHEPLQIVSTFTDALGNFEFHLQDTGTVIVEAIDLAGNSTGLQMHLARQHIEPVRAVMRASALVVGMLQPPLSADNFYSISILGYRTVRANAQGLFTIELPVGSYALTILDQLREVSGIRLFIDSLLPGEIRDLGTIELPKTQPPSRTAIVQGIVEPKPDSLTRYVIQSGATISSATDPLGRFSLTVPSGPCTLVVIRRAESISSRLLVPVQDLLPGEIRDIGTIAFPALASESFAWIIGTIRPKPPVANSYIVVVSGVNQTTADTSGYFRMRLPVGSHVVEIINRRQLTASVMTIPVESLTKDEVRNLGEIQLD